MKNFIKDNKEYVKSISLVLIIQAIVYFIINLSLTKYHFLDTNLNVPFIKYFIYIYHSWYPFVFFLSYLIFKDNKDVYKKLIYTLAFGFILSNLTFIIYPSTIIRPTFEVKSITDWIVNLTYKLDNPTNCLPSEHCLVCFILIYYLNKTNIKPLTKILSTSYLILIILSTLFTKQHLPIDVIFAFIYSTLIILLVKQFYPKLKETLKFLF